MEFKSDVVIRESVAELLPFLSPSSIPKARADALQFLVGLTGNEEGIQLLKAHWKLLEAVIDLAFTDVDGLDVSVNIYSPGFFVSLDKLG